MHSSAMRRRRIKDNLQVSDRGFAQVTFKDYHDATVRVYESSLATEDTLWLCIESDGALKDKSVALLTVENVRDMLPYLTKFVETSSIIDPDIRRTVMEGQEKI